MTSGKSSAVDLIDWTWKKYSELSKDELYEIFQLRQRVFIVEQKCPYLDADGVDQKSEHVWGRSRSSKAIVAYARLPQAGVKYKELSIGRVVTAPEMRGSGLGREIMKEILRKFPKDPIRISAQAYLEKFYTEFGFKKVHGPYDEDGIPHIEMLRSIAI